MHTENIIPHGWYVSNHKLLILHMTLVVPAMADCKVMDNEQQDRRWNAEKPSATLDP